MATQQQIADEQRSMERAGIKRRYYARSLSTVEHPAVAEIQAWVGRPQSETAGHGYVFIGGNTMEDLAIITARALHLTGRSAMVLPLMTFAQRLLGERDEREALRERMDEVTTLCLINAGPTDRDDEVFSRRELRILETKLDDWLSAGDRLILHSRTPLRTGWYSPQFLQRVAAVNKTFEGAQ